MHHATKSLCGECVWVSKWAAQLKTILVAKWEVPVSKRERLPKRVVTPPLLADLFLYPYEADFFKNKLTKQQKHHLASLFAM